MKIEIQKLFIATKLKFVSRKPNNKLSPTEQWCLKTLGVYHGVPHHGDNHPNSQHYQVLSRRISTILCEKDVYPKVAMCCHGKWWWTILGRPIFRPISQHPCHRNSRLFRIRQGDWSLTAAPAERFFDHAMKCFTTCVRMRTHACMLLYIHVIIQCGAP